ncbi:MAG: hypothetical protein ACF8CY_00190, partial [Gimesia chilikensis]
MTPRTYVIPILLVTCLAGFLCPAHSQAATETDTAIKLFPQSIDLRGSEARQGLSVQTLTNDEVTGPVTTPFQLTSSNPDVVIIEDQTAVPVGNGTAQITVQSGSSKSTSQVTVSGLDQPHRWSFRNDI